MSQLIMAERTTAPPAPIEGKSVLYFRNGAWYFKGFDDVEVPLAATVVNPAFINFITSGSNPAHLAGRLFWDVENLTMAFHTDIPGVTNQIGQEIYVRGRNISGGALQNGRAVYIAGVSAGRPRFEYATNTPTAVAGKTIGVLTHMVANASEGLATVLGSVGDLNTSAWAAGDVLYLDAANGQLTNVKPTPSLTTMLVRIGIVLISDAVTGKIFVNPDITPIITDVGGAGTMAQQNANAVAITGGSAVNLTELGVGTDPTYSWGAGWAGVAVGPTGTLANSGTTTPVTALSNNAYFDGTNWRYIASGPAAQWQCSTNQFIFRQAVSGTAGAVITWIETGRFDSNGNFGVGVVPSAKLHVESATTQTTLFKSTSTASGDISDLQVIGNDTQLRITAYGSTHGVRPSQVWINSVSAPAGLIFATANTERGRFSAAGNFLSGKAIDDTFAKIQSSNGITLGNTANANATVLDWYEEGTWTPILRFGGVASGTYSVRVGEFTRKGQEVTLHCAIALTAVGAATGNCTIAGFPFTSKPGVPTVTVFQGDALSFSGSYPFVYQPGNSTDCALFGGNNAGVAVQLTHANFSSTSTLRFTLKFTV